VLAVVLGVAGCRNCETSPESGPRQSDPSTATGQAKAEKKAPAKDGDIEDSWFNSDRAKKISRDLERSTD
jgi:hypothetical protein